MLYCKDCDKYWKFGGNDDKGVCSLPESYFPVDAEQPCVYLNKKKKTCERCSHFRNDTACFTADKDDEACVGFEDILDGELMLILFQMLKNGEYSRQRIENLCILFEQTPEYRFVFDKLQEEVENNE